jgi:hypothetical protein
MHILQSSIRTVWWSALVFDQPVCNDLESRERNVRQLEQTVLHLASDVAVPPVSDYQPGRRPLHN